MNETQAAVTAELKPPPQMPWEWALDVLSGFDFWIVVMLFLAGAVGILWSYFCQAKKGQVPWCFTQYMLDHPGATASSIMGLMAGIAAMSNFASFYDGPTVLWWKVLVYGFGVGLFADVSLNRAEVPDKPRAVLTDEQRAALRDQPKGA